MPFEGNSILGLVNRLRGAFYHRNDRTMTVYGLRVNAASKTADYTMLASDYVITVACSSANITITLPDAALSAGQIYTVVKTDATEYTVVVDPAGADTINGLGAYSMFGQYAAASFFSNGTAWYFAPRQRDDIYQAKTSNYTLGKFDGAIECTSGTFALTLPTAVGAVGRIYRLKNTGAGTITINTTSAQTVDAYASGALTLAQYDAYAVMSNGANWIILGKVGAAAVSGTSGKLAKFTGTNTVGNSIMTESGSKIEITGGLVAIGQADTNQLVVKGHSTQTSPQILIQSSAAAELTRFYVNAAGAIALGYQAGNALGAAGETVAIGYQAGLATTDNGGVYIGYLAGKAVTANGLTVQTNIAIGSGALQTNTTGYGNVAIGLESMKVYTGKQSIAIGDRTMLKATSGLYNFAFGEEAVYNLVSGHYNEGIGIQALFSNTGSGNIGVGAWALYSNVSGSDNVVFGTNGAFHNTGSYNVEIGGNVGYNSLGSNSIMIGYEAGRTSGSATITDSVYIGYRAGYGASAGNNNVGIGSGALPKTVANAVAVGYQAGAVQTGAGFTAVGYQAGIASTSGTNSTLIGSGAGASLTTSGGAVMIGYQAGGSETAANKLYIHNSNSATPLIYGDFAAPSLTFNGTVTHADGYNIVLGTTTGSKLGTATSQKLGVWNATPIVQPTTGVAAATFTANAGTAVNDASTFDGYTIGQVVKALRNIGWLA